VIADVNMHLNVVLCFICSCERTASNFPDANLGRKLFLYAGFFEVRISCNRYLEIRCLTHRKHAVFSAVKTSGLMLYGEITVCYMT
jgi:hypothetical protein